MERYILYWRKTNRHNWRIAGTADEWLGLARIVYLAQKDGPGWELGVRVYSSHTNSLDINSVDNLKPNHPMVRHTFFTQYYQNGEFNTLEQVADSIRCNSGLRELRRTDKCDGLGCDRRLPEHPYVARIGEGLLEEELILCGVCYFQWNVPAPPPL
jgi:hypothetical protein